MQSPHSFLRLGTDFLAHIITGALIGYGIDTWSNTAPLWMIVFILLGFGSACRTLWKGTQTYSVVPPSTPDDSLDKDER